MSLSVLISLIAGMFLGAVIADWRPMWRWGLPGLSLLLGMVLFRQSVRELGPEAVESGLLNSTGLSGLMLILLGLMTLLTVVIVHLGAALGRSRRISRRRK